MKFKKGTSSSPKMELLSHRSSTSRLSTFKRTKSFRASVRLMSKIRNHTNLNLNRSLSPVSLHSKTSETRSNQWSLSFLQKKVESFEKSKKTDPISEKCRAGQKTGVKSHSLNSEITESNKISKDLKQKLSLTNRIMGRHKKTSQDNDKISGKHESQESSKSLNYEHLREVQPKDAEKISREKLYPIHPGGQCNSYENPTFCLDSSIDSSVSSFLYEVQPEDLDDVENSTKKNSSKDDHPEINSLDSKKTEMLTIVVDSERNDIILGDNEVLKENNDVTRRNSRINKSLRSCCRTKEESRKIEETKYNNYERLGEENEFSFNRVVLRSARDKLDETGFDTRCESRGVEEPLRDKVSANSSKFLRPRTVDNIANFWSGGRSSFRVKRTNRKKVTHETRDLESISHDQVLMTTTSGSSRSLSPCKVEISLLEVSLLI